MNFKQFYDKNRCIFCRKLINQNDSIQFYKGYFSHTSCSEENVVNFYDFVDRCENKDESVIPEGQYCYTRNSKGIIPCPYWRINKDKKYMENGVCIFLDIEDGEDTSSLLWDQCKECRIKNDI